MGKQLMAATAASGISMPMIIITMWMLSKWDITFPPEVSVAMQSVLQWLFHAISLFAGYLVWRWLKVNKTDMDAFLAWKAQQSSGQVNGGGK